MYYIIVCINPASKSITPHSVSNCVGGEHIATGYIKNGEIRYA